MQKLSFDKRRIKFLFLEGIHANASHALAHDGYSSVRSLPKSLAGDALRAALKDVHFLGIRSRTELTEEVLAAAPFAEDEGAVAHEGAGLGPGAGARGGAAGLLDAGRVHG